MLQFAAHSENPVLWLVKGVFCVSTIKPDERLAVTLRYLATGETFDSLEYSFRISGQSILTIV